MDCNRRATVVVLSAGMSPYLREVLLRVSESTECDMLRLVWSGVVMPPSDLPPGTHVALINPSSFDHGGTRQLMSECCASEFIVFLSDDATPASREWLPALLAPFGDPDVVAVFGRQQARPDASVAERSFRASRYPSMPLRFDRTALREYGTVTAPFSDANAAYRTEALRAVGGFPRPCAHGEDVLVAVRLLNAGGTIAYEPRAAVWHSHDHTVDQVFRRGYHAGSVAVAVEHSISERLDRSGGLRLAGAMLWSGWRTAGLGGALSVCSALLSRALGYALGSLVRSTIRVVDRQR